MVRKPRPGDWTEEEVSTLRRYAHEGLSQQEAAERLGRKLKSVQHKSQSLRLAWSSRRYQQWGGREIAKLRKYAKQHTTSEVAAMLGRTRDSVALKAARLNISFLKYGENCNLTKYPSSQVAEMFRLRGGGWTQREIAAELGVSVGQVKRVLNFRSRWRDAIASWPVSEGPKP